MAYVTTYDALNVRSWSGLGYYIAQSLEQQAISIDYVGQLKEKASLWIAAKKQLYGRIVKQRYRTDREPIILKSYAHQVAKKLATLNAEIVFSPGSIPIAYLDCHQPIVFWTDATFAGMIDFYPTFNNLCKETIRNGNRMERAALNRSALAIYSSEWAAGTAIKHYQINPSKVRVVPFGANVECNRTLQDIKSIVDSRSSDKCKLLFLGVDWYRKGGDIALEVAQELNRSGLTTELTIAGCQPSTREPLPGFVRSMGFINKSTSEGQLLIAKLLAETHFLILPSRAEAFGIVFCEAGSFGVPSLSTDSGGIPTIIKNDVNGKIFSKGVAIGEYCKYISGLFCNYRRYKDLALSSFNEYQSRLNWAVAGQTVRALLKEVVS